ncbi:hypothetical protein TrVFT333_004908 [Trichoderma virens FT-333]|nr:hypothetical protein TrVFT333_004908 [Trichoderma virens FT-333]
MATSMRTKRVAKERQKAARIKDLSADHGQIDKYGLPPGIELVDGNDLKEWLFDIRVLDNNPLYNDKVYQLKFVFSESYPIGNLVLPAPRIARLGARRLTDISRTPEVTFVDRPARPVPMHPHIYSNGIICLDLLGNQGWSPVQSAESVCMSIQSMLTSNNKNERPPGDEEFVRGNKQRPRDIEFLYHDNTV